MLIAVLAFLGGMLTIVSPCILPVLPFVFARADRSFTRGALPLLAQTEPPVDEEPATVLGDLTAATTLLAWFDRAQGLKPRA